MDSDLPKSLLNASAITNILDLAQTDEFKGKEVGLTQDGRLVVVKSHNVSRKKRLAKFMKEAGLQHKVGEGDLSAIERKGIKAIKSDKVVSHLKSIKEKLSTKESIKADEKRKKIEEIKSNLEETSTTNGMDFDRLGVFCNNKIKSMSKAVGIDDTEFDKNGNKIKLDENRYRNIMPPKHTAIKVTDKDGTRKYMNANKIAFEPLTYGHRPRTYIRMQHPLPAASDQPPETDETSARFTKINEKSKGATFKMFYENNVGKVSNLTNLSTNNNGKTQGDRCPRKKTGRAFDYWPAAGESAEYDNIKVTTESIVKDEDGTKGYDVITMKLEDTNLSEAQRARGAKTVTMFHYHGWPDHGAPEGESRDQYMKYLEAFREHPLKPGQTTCTHCHAGVGRTGSDILIKQMMDEIDLGVMDKDLCKMRLNNLLFQARVAGGPSMVQTKEQWQFVQETVESYFQKHLSQNKMELQDVPPPRPLKLDKKAGPEYVNAAFEFDESPQMELQDVPPPRPPKLDKKAEPVYVNGGFDGSPQMERRESAPPAPPRVKEPSKGSSSSESDAQSLTSSPSISRSSSNDSLFSSSSKNSKSSTSTVDSSDTKSVSSADSGVETVRKDTLDPKNYRIAHTPKDIEEWSKFYFKFISGEENGYFDKNGKLIEEKRDDFIDEIKAMPLVLIKLICVGAAKEGDMKAVGILFNEEEHDRDSKSLMSWVFGVRLVEELVEKYGIEEVKEKLDEIKYLKNQRPPQLRLEQARKRLKELEEYYKSR